MSPRKCRMKVYPEILTYRGIFLAKNDQCYITGMKGVLQNGQSIMAAKQGFQKQKGGQENGTGR